MVKNIIILDLYQHFDGVGLSRNDFSHTMDMLCKIWINNRSENLNHETRLFIYNYLGLPEVLASHLYANASYRLNNLASEFKSISQSGELESWFVTGSSIMLRFK